MADIQMSGRGLRGESFADVARRVGNFAGITVPEGSTDASVLASIVNRSVSAANEDIQPKVTQAINSAASALQSAEQAGAYATAVQQAAGEIPANTAIHLRAATRAELASFTGMTAGEMAYLAESERAGWFKWFTGNFATQVTADPLQGIFVASTSNPTGSAGVWQRYGYMGIVRPEWFGAARNAVKVGSVYTGTNDTPSFRAADNAPGAHTMLLAAGGYMLEEGTNNASIILNNTSLTGAGADKTVLYRKPATLGAQSAPSSLVVVPNGRKDVFITDIGINCQRSGNGGTANDRCNGIATGAVTGLTIRRVVAQNVVGYSFFPTNSKFGIIDDCRSYNAQVHFEPVACEDYILSNCHARHGAAAGGILDGGSEVGSEASFHTYGATKRLTIFACSHFGNGFPLLLSSTVNMEDINVISSIFVQTGNGMSGYIGGSGAVRLARIKVSDCYFYGTNALGLQMEFCDDAVLNNNRISGFGLGLSVQGASTVSGVGNIIEGRSAGASAAAYGVLTSGVGTLVELNGGGRITAATTAPGSAAYSGTIVVGYDVTVKPELGSRILSDSGTAHNIEATQTKRHRWMGAAGVKTVTVRPESSHALPDGGEWHYMNWAGAEIVFSKGAGVQIFPAATLKIPPGGSATLKRIAADVFQLIGDKVA